MENKELVPSDRDVQIITALAITGAATIFIGIFEGGKALGRFVRCKIESKNLKSEKKSQQ